MSYRFKSAVPIGAELVRVVEEQVNAAVSVLRDRSGDPRSIHQARKSCKKARAALRLGRTVLGDQGRRLNERIRDAARHLSASRDEFVAAQTLRTYFAEVEGADEVIAALEARSANSPQANAAGQSDVDEAVSLLADVQRSLADLEPNEPIDQHGSSQAWRRSVKRARQARRQAARSDAHPERFHDLRKRMKDLWYHARLLRKRGPKAVGRLVGKLGPATEQLGLLQDLAVVDSAVRSVPGVETHALLDAIDRRRRKLQRQCLKQCKSVLASARRVKRWTD